jgi:hypothetical protein
MIPRFLVLVEVPKNTENDLTDPRREKNKIKIIVNIFSFIFAITQISNALDDLNNTIAMSEAHKPYTMAGSNSLERYDARGKYLKGREGAYFAPRHQFRA